MMTKLAYIRLNRRTQATLEDGSFWQYGYDDRDEVTSAKRNWSYFSTTTPVSGQQFGYAYDNIGNRLTAAFGGDTNGANLRTVSYVANSLNQYTNIVTPGTKEIIGAALATNGVTVNGGTADRHGEYFHREISVANTNQPVWQNVTTVAGTFTNQGGSVFPAYGQTLVYDADGNLSFDGIWNYQWDGENRLISMNMTNVTSLAATNRLRLDFAYDYQGRRVEKRVSHWNSGSWILDSDSLFIYDGWNLLAVVNPQSAVFQSFMWGKDLSGTLARAGGVGGLLMANTSGTNCFATYDGNGNITALINTTDKSLAARYEYSPYGELLRATGLLAHRTPFRFSTKYWDDESGLIYFGYRYYNAALGRWISKDTSGEKNGANLYTLLYNCPVMHFDTLGNEEYFVDYNGVRNIETIIKSSLNAAFLVPGVAGKAIAYSLMYNWFGGDLPGSAGTYDFSAETNPMHSYTFDVGLAKPVSDAEAGNFIAGFAGGYASFASGGDPSFAGGIFAAGFCYGVGDIGIQVYTASHRGAGLVAGLKGYVSSITMQYDGYVEGASDAIDGWIGY